MDCGSIGLFSLDALNVDDILLPVDLHHFANLLAFVMSTDNLFVNKPELMRVPESSFFFYLPWQTLCQFKMRYLDFVIFADGHRPHVVLLAELLGQWGRHDLPPDVWRGIEMPLAVLAAGGCYKWVQLHDARDPKKQTKHKQFNMVKHFPLLVLLQRDKMRLSK